MRPSTSQELIPDVFAEGTFVTLRYSSMDGARLQQIEGEIIDRGDELLTLREPSGRERYPDGPDRRIQLDCTDAAVTSITLRATTNLGYASRVLMTAPPECSIAAGLEARHIAQNDGELSQQDLFEWFDPDLAEATD